MKFGAKWNVKGVRREARATAREAARRSGVSVGEWLNNVIIEQASEEGIEPPDFDRDEDEGQAAVNDRLVEAIDRIDRRLDGLIARNHFAVREFDRRRGPERYAPRDYFPQAYAAAAYPPPHYPQAYGPAAYAPPGYPGRAAVTPPGSIDAAVAEIAARQRTLDGEQPPAQPSPPPLAPAAPPAAPWFPPVPAFGDAAGPVPGAPAQDLSGLELQLRHITDQLEKLQRPSELENAVAALRQELADIGKTLAEALPRRAIEALEGEVRALAQRIDQTRQCGVDPATIAGMERALIEVRNALRGLTPAEKLVGFDEAIKGLAHKIDLMASTSQDPASLHQLEAAITALRGIVSHVASNEALAKLGEEMRGLSAKIERVASSPAAAGADALAALEQRVAALGDLLKITAMGPLPPQLEQFIKAVNEKLDQIDLSRGDKAALSHLEDRIVSLVEKLDASDARLHHLGAIERGIADLLVHLDQMRPAGAMGMPAKAQAEPVEALKRDISRAEDSLENVHGALDQVVDRLAAIETDMRASAVPAAKPAVPEVRPAAPAVPMISPPAAPAAPAPAKSSAPRPQRDRQPIDPNLPPDYPLEPGAGSPRGRGAASTAERIAASEAALGPARTAAPGPAAQSNFIAAARRAAQAAAPAAAPNAPGAENGKDAKDSSTTKAGSSFAKRVRSLLVGSSVVLIIVGGLRLAVNLLDPTSRSDPDATATTQAAPPAAPAASAGPKIISVGPGPQSALTAPDGGESDDGEADAPTPIDGGNQNNDAVNKSDVTGSLPPAPATAPDFQPSALPALPDNLPLPLRTAGAAGDRAAAYEIALRYLEGRGVPVNLEQAFRWMDHAAKGGLALAQFRLGSLYEKGQGVKKDTAAARRLYQAAAEKGNAKAMHNLAVLYAEGADGKPDYKSAALWFRRGADRGIADSQYNLGILYARGIGATQNLAESYKWFSLAAAQGDKDAAVKRDEIAGRLDHAALTAAKLAAQTWTAEPQPAEATTVPVPPGGWEKTATAAPVRKIAPARKSKPPVGAPMKITPQ
jgi:localization factor PodJL